MELSIMNVNSTSAFSDFFWWLVGRENNMLRLNHQAKWNCF